MLSSKEKLNGQTVLELGLCADGRVRSRSARLGEK